MTTIKEVLKQYSGQYNTLTVQRPYIKFTGSIEGGMFLSQIIYWSERTNEAQGWFYKSYPDWESEICIKQKSAHKWAVQWIAAGFLETKVVKNPAGIPVVHYRFLMDEFVVQLEWFMDKPDRLDGKTQTASSVGLEGKSSVLADGKARSARSINPNGEMEKPDRLGPPYIHQIHTSNTSSTTSNQDPECAIEIKTCQVEIVREEEQTEAAHPLALDQTGNALTVNGLKKGGDKCSAPGRAALASPVAADMAVKVDATAIVCDDMGHNGFNGFRDKYQLLAASVRRKFGRMDEAKAAWKAAWKGFEPPEAFWKGLACYYEQQQDEYLRKGDCWMVGAKRFLDPEERHWEAAITLHQVNQQAQAFGVDMNNPAEVKRASLAASNLRNWEIAKQQMILKGVAI